jgi:hypothetical protein
MRHTLKTIASLALFSAMAFAQASAPKTEAQAGGSTTQQPAPAAQAEKVIPELMPLVSLPRPEIYAVSFLPLLKGNDSVAFVVSPDGKLGTLPMQSIGEAYKNGYRPFTVADLLAITNAIADEEKNLLKRTKELSEDYDALVTRYNRLAAINSAALVAVQPQPTVDERQAMRAMLFQSLLQRAIPAPPIRVEIQRVDCTKFPALCVSH